jgi:hypothetical protein
MREATTSQAGGGVKMPRRLMPRPAVLPIKRFFSGDREFWSRR